MGFNCSDCKNISGITLILGMLAMAFVGGYFTARSTTTCTGSGKSESE